MNYIKKKGSWLLLPLSNSEFSKEEKGVDPVYLHAYKQKSTLLKQTTLSGQQPLASTYIFYWPLFKFQGTKMFRHMKMRCWVIDEGPSKPVGMRGRIRAFIEIGLPDDIPRRFAGIRAVLFN